MPIFVHDYITNIDEVFSQRKAFGDAVGVHERSQSGRSCVDI